MQSKRRSEQNGKQAAGTAHACLTDELLFYYLENKVSGKTRRMITQHLNNCPSCRHKLASLIKHAFHESTAEEEELLGKMQMPSKEMMLSVLFPTPEKKRRPANWFGFSGMLSRAFPQVRRAAAVVPIFILIVAGMAIVNYFGSGTRQNDYAAYIELAAANHAVPFRSVRPAGKYPPSPASRILSAKQQPTDSLQAATNALQQIQGNAQILQKLAHLYIFENNITMADSILASLKDRGAPSAALITDLGVIAFKKQNFNRAADYFIEALQTSPAQIVALYNLAITEVQLGEIGKAVQHLQQYVQLEPDESWRRSALEVIRELGYAPENKN